MKRLFIFFIFMGIIISLNFNLVFGSEAFPINVSKIDYENNNTHFVIASWKNLPFKQLRANLTWIKYVNNYSLLDPLLPWNEYVVWDNNGESTPSKCLSYSAATINDWFSIQEGKPLMSYQNFVNNVTENGTNPRFLEAIYLNHGEDKNYDFAWPFRDPITGEKMPYDIKGYADILKNSPNNLINKPNSYLINPTDNFTYTVLPEEYLENYKIEPINVKNNNEIKGEKYGF